MAEKIFVFGLEIPVEISGGGSFLLISKEISCVDCLEETLHNLFNDKRIKVTEPKHFKNYIEIKIENVYTRGCSDRPWSFKWSRGGISFLYCGFLDNDEEKERATLCFETIFR